VVLFAHIFDSGITAGNTGMLFESFDDFGADLKENLKY
jgi:hypothetical protein